MASPQAKDVEKIIYDYKAGVIGSGQVLTLDQRRSKTEAELARWATARNDVTSEDLELGGRPARLHTPDRVDPGMVVLYLHGGGYVMGSLHSHGPLMAHLAHLTSTPVYGLDFRRAPEHPYPAALEDTRAAYDALLAKGWAPEQIVLAGDSAGAGLALAVMARLRDEGGAVPAGGILMSPWLDLALTGASMEKLADVDPWTTRAALELFAGMYAGDAPVDHPEVSPVNMDFRGLPPLLIHVSASEILLDDARTAQDKASAAGVDVEFRSWEGVPHVFQLFAGFLPEADESLRDIADWFEKRRTS